MISKDSVKIATFAKQIIEKEIEAVEKLRGYIDNDFCSVVEEILASKGRIIISGIGKSAIIGSKIVATLNSTGTPAIFMHAADAIHGDLGMVQQDDIVVILSKSGNTPEIKALVPMVKNLGFNSTIVAMVGNKSSYLATESTYILDCTVEKEACPMNLAPTTSTTVQLVMGDALAMTLLEMKGFTANDFAKVHPGGALGKKLYCKVCDLTSKERKPMVDENATIEEVIFEISSKMLGATAVVNKNANLVGVITDGDLRRMLQSKVEISKVRAKDIMSKNPKVIDTDALAIKAFEIMEDNKITQLLVVDESKQYSGIVHIHDILREGVV